MPAEDSEAPEVAERILRQGLAVPGVRDRADLDEHLETLRQENGATPATDEAIHAIDVSPSGGAAKLMTKVTFVCRRGGT